MVLVGLVLGVIVAVIVAAQGCGGSHPRRHVAEGSGAGGGAGVAGAAGTAGTGTASTKGALASRRSSSSALAPPRRLVRRRSDPQGPFFGFRGARVARVDAPRGDRDVALTFDDGPGPQTDQLLGELRRLHAHATFFVVGSMAAIRPAVVRREAHDRMEIGNHTWSHPILVGLPAAAQRSEIERANAIIRKLTGRRPRFFRPPSWRFTAATARVLRREGMVGTLRTVDTRDWTLPGVRAIIRSALRVRAGGIVAMHDAGGYTRTQTLEAVPHIVRGLRRRHLRLVTVAQLYDGRG